MRRSFQLRRGIDSTDGTDHLERRLRWTVADRGQRMAGKTRERPGVAPRDLPRIPRGRDPARKQAAYGTADGNRHGSQAGVGDGATIRQRVETNRHLGRHGSVSKLPGMRRTNRPSRHPTIAE